MERRDAERREEERGGIAERIRERLSRIKRRSVYADVAHPPEIVFSKPERAETYTKFVVEAILEGRPPSAVALIILDYFKTAIDEWLYAVTTRSEELAFERFVQLAAMLARSLNALVAHRLAEHLAKEEHRRVRWRDLYSVFVTALTDAQVKFLFAVGGALHLNRPGANALAWSKYGVVRL
jgi:hypothetical protein